MRTLTLLSIFLLGSNFANTVAQGANSASAFPPLLREVEQIYGRQATLKADFSQVDFIASTQLSKKSSGTIYFKRPDKIRWETLAPDRNLLVSDGKKFWFYTPPFDESERGQVIEQKSAQVQSKLAQDLLSGKISTARNMKVKALGDHRFQLTPKKRSAGSLAQIEIQLNEQSKRIVQLVLLHQGGNRTTIDLSAIEFGPTLGDEFFQFTPPPNTDRIQAN